MPSEEDLILTARAVRQIKDFLQSPDQVAAYLASIIRSGKLDTGGASAPAASDTVEEQP